jgi:8-oxo-dGTP diphosphatase
MNVSFGQKQPAVLIILKNKDKFLLLKRNKDPNKNKYTPVGGKIDSFESPFLAAIRETFEETGIKISTARYCGVLVETSPAKYNWICFVYAAEIAYHQPVDCKEGKLEWINRSELLNISTPETDRYIYEYYLAGKSFMFSAEYDKDIHLVTMKEEIENKLIIKNKR